jgi:iron complex transport system substrate-binding protein
MLKINEITGAIVDTALEIHTQIGPGLLESVYEAVLARRLIARGLAVQRQKPILIRIDGMSFDEGFRADLVVEQRVLVELKSTEQNHPVHGKQLLTHLRLGEFRVGLLINFGLATLKEGLKRVVNHLPEEESLPGSSA